MILSALQQAAVDGIKTRLPSLRQCDSIAGKFNLDALKSMAVHPPAVMVALFPVKPVTRHAESTISVPVQLAAFICVKNEPKLKASVAALNLVESLLAWLPGEKFGLAVGGAQAVECENLFDNTQVKQGISLWVVKWAHAVRLSTLEENGVLPAELYAAWAPNIGEAYKDDYEKISEMEVPPV